MSSQRGTDQNTDPVCLSPQLLGISVAHRSSVHVVSFTRCDTPFHLSVFPTSHYVVRTFTRERIVFILSSHRIPPFILILPLSLVNPLLASLFETLYMRPGSLSCFLAAYARGTRAVFRFMPRYPTRLIRNRCLYLLIYVCPTLFRCSVLVLVPLSMCYEFAYGKYTRF
jgi:hypothetical protein